MRAVEVALESIDVGRPEAAELSQPGVDFLQRFGLQPVEAALGIHRGLNETCIPEHAQMLRHGRLRHV